MIVPAKAGPITTGSNLAKTSCQTVSPVLAPPSCDRSRGMGPGLRRDDCYVAIALAAMFTVSASNAVL
ncbi:hypothetical protein ABIB73_002521 [Bradyrhizobium sp. F1.4.3]